MSLEQAIRLNNAAVSFLVLGDDRIAAKVFTDSLKTVKSLIIDGEQATSTTSQDKAPQFEHGLLHSTTELPCFKRGEENFVFQGAIVLNNASSFPSPDADVV